MKNSTNSEVLTQHVTGESQKPRIGWRLLLWFDTAVERLAECALGDTVISPTQEAEINTGTAWVNSRICGLGPDDTGQVLKDIVIGAHPETRLAGRPLPEGLTEEMASEAVSYATNLRRQLRDTPPFQP